MAVVAVLMRRSRRREALKRWRANAIDAYVQARMIEDLTLREPAGTPDLYRRIADASATFHALARSSPDLPSTQAAYIVADALEDLETALKAAGAPPVEMTVSRYRFNHALSVLRPLLGDVAPATPYGP